MKCQVCGSESGKYPLCRACNIKKEQGLIIKCDKCGKWHYANASCPETNIKIDENAFLYEAKNRVISKSESEFFTAIKASVPEKYNIFPQISLASMIDRTDNSRFVNELFRSVDFLVTDENYKPAVVIEIQDQTHYNNDRRERDEKVKNILEEAGIPLVKLWTQYGVNPGYIKEKLDEALNNPKERIHHFRQETKAEEEKEEGREKYVPKMDITMPTPPSQESTDTSSSSNSKPAKKQGCYIATCVYGSYDSPEVMLLRRYRDSYLSKFFLGMLFIQIYYFFSPTVVKIFGRQRWFNRFWKKYLDKKVRKLEKIYTDQQLKI